jgi:hypothetical protein
MLKEQHEAIGGPPHASGLRSHEGEGRVDVEGPFGCLQALNSQLSAFNR